MRIGERKAGKHTEKQENTQKSRKNTRVGDMYIGRMGCVAYGQKWVWSERTKKREKHLVDVSDDELRRLRCEPPALSLGAASVEKRHHEESRL